MNNDLPASIILNNNIPNPFNPMTTIGYELLSDSDVELSIYDMNGKKIITLVNDHISAGNHKINWDASGYSSGVYLYRLNARGIVITKKMVLLK
jgi:flagellar hook assembly protein FlgD